MTGTGHHRDDSHAPLAPRTSQRVHLEQPPEHAAHRAAAARGDHPTASTTGPALADPLVGAPWRRRIPRVRLAYQVMARPPRPAHEGPDGPEPAIGDDQVDMGMPVGEGAVGLEAGDDPHRQILAGGSADGGGHGPSGHPGEVA
jgi:hypothetical protein